MNRMVEPIHSSESRQALGCDFCNLGMDMMHLTREDQACILAAHYRRCGWDQISNFCGDPMSQWPIKKEAVCCVLSSTALAPSIASIPSSFVLCYLFYHLPTFSKLNHLDFNLFWSGEMWQLMASVKRSLHQRTRHRITDETMVTVDGLCRVQGGSPRSSFFQTLFAPLTLLGCFSPQNIAGEQGMWLSGELARASDRDFLMVRDSMRYAIYV